MRKYFQSKELRNLRSFKKRKQLRKLKLKRWNRNSFLPKPFKRLKQLQQRRQQLKLILLDWRESMNFQEERLKPNSKCSRSNNKWKPNKLLIWKKLDSRRKNFKLKNKQIKRPRNKCLHNNKLLKKLKQKRKLLLKLRHKLKWKLPLKPRQKLN